VIPYILVNSLVEEYILVIPYIFSKLAFPPNIIPVDSSYYIYSLSPVSLLIKSKLA